MFSRKPKNQPKPKSPEEIQKGLQEYTKKELEEGPEPQKIEDFKVPQPAKIDKKGTGPTLFQALGMKQNRHIMNTFIVVTVLLILISFGSFFLFRAYLPKMVPSMNPKNSAAYACGISCIFAHIFIFGFFIYGRKYDMEEFEREKAKKQ